MVLLLLHQRDAVRITNTNYYINQKKEKKKCVQEEAMVFLLVEKFCS
jgi:hypothetical protein